MISPLAQAVAPRSSPVFLLCAVLLAAASVLTQRSKSLLWRDRRWATSPNAKQLLFAVSLLLFWMLIQTARSPFPALAVRDVAYIAFAFAAFALVVPVQTLAGLQKFRLFLLAGMIAGGLFLISELTGLTNFHWVPRLLFFNDLLRGAIFLVMLGFVLPLISGDKTIHRVLATCAAGLAVIAAFLSVSQSAQLALVAGLLTGAVLMIAPFLRRPIYILMAAIMLLMPWSAGSLKMLNLAFDNQLTRSAHVAERLTIWEDYSAAVNRKPFWGWGARADRSLGQDSFYTREIGHTVRRGSAYPHNMAIEIWTNLGFVGIALFTAILLLLGEVIGRFQRTPMIVASQLVVAVWTFSMFHSTVLQSWWIASVTSAAIAFGVAHRHWSMSAAIRSER